MNTAQENQIKNEDITTLSLAVLYIIPFLIALLGLKEGITGYYESTAYAWTAQSFPNQTFLLETFSFTTQGKSPITWYEIHISDQNKNTLLYQRLDNTLSNINKQFTDKTYSIQNVSIFIATDKNGKIITKKLDKAELIQDNGTIKKIYSGNTLPNNERVIKKYIGYIIFGTILSVSIYIGLIYTLITLYKQKSKPLFVISVCVFIYFSHYIWIGLSPVFAILFNH